MKKSLKLLLFMFLINCIFQIGNAAIRTENQALTLVRNKFASQEVNLFKMPDESAASADYWYFFVDAEPMKGWEHDCYVVKVTKTVNNDNSDISMSLQKRPPSENLTPAFIFNRYGARANDKPNIVPNSNRVSNSTGQNTYAIILSGGSSKYYNYERYWNDCSFIYQTLRRTYLVPSNNITVIMADGTNPAPDMLTSDGYVSSPLDLDGDGVADIKYSATVANISNAFAAIQSKAKSGDNLFFFVIDHGGSVDGKGSSYINLWGNEVLQDTQLAQIISPIIAKEVAVNVVLGQCYSGGFVDNLEKEGCIVATASNERESSWACSDIPYDEFVYLWTSAINGATPYGMAVDADANHDGYISMAEAFDYAITHDSRTEHPQYCSTPAILGESHAFDNLAKPVELYISDFEGDTGMTNPELTNPFWHSPNVWIRNSTDGGTEHVNPYYSDDHKSAFGYARITNRGWKTYTGGQFLHFYWSEASTSNTTDAWMGNEKINGNATGGRFGPAKLTRSIAPGESLITNARWDLPAWVFENDTEKSIHGWNIVATISDSQSRPIDATEIAETFDIAANPKSAEFSSGKLSPSGLSLSEPFTLHFRNVSNKSKRFAFEAKPASENDEEFYDNFSLTLTIPTSLYQNWVANGLKTTNVDISEGATTTRIYLKSSGSRIYNILLAGNFHGTASLSMSSRGSVPALGQLYKVNLIQSDATGAIAGGLTVVAQMWKLVTPFPPIGISSSNDSGIETLSVELNDDEEVYAWLDANGNVIGDTKTIQTIPSKGNDSFSVLVTNSEDEMAMASIQFDIERTIHNVIYKGNGIYEVTIGSSVLRDASIVVTSCSTGQEIINMPISVSEDKYLLNISGNPSDMYLISIISENNVLDTWKIKK